MADNVDTSNDKEQAIRDKNVALLRDAARNMPLGVQGDCDLCGEWSGRLVVGVCAPCRDRRGLV